MYVSCEAGNSSHCSRCSLDRFALLVFALALLALLTEQEWMYLSFVLPQEGCC